MYLPNLSIMNRMWLKINFKQSTDDWTPEFSFS